MKSLLLLPALVHLTLAAPQLEWEGGFQGPFGIGNQFCNLCPSTYCVGPAQCQCENTAALACYEISLGLCTRPKLPSCPVPGVSGTSSAAAPVVSAPTMPGSQYPPCGKNLAPCASGYTCDRRFTQGCVDLSNSGNCVGICMPNTAPLQSAWSFTLGSLSIGVSRSTTTRAAATATATATARPIITPAPAAPAAAVPAPVSGVCRGVGYDNDCPANAHICVADPAAPRGASTSGICVSAAVQCGGNAGTSCPSGSVCLDDPRDACPDNVVGCLGICVKVFAV